MNRLPLSKHDLAPDTPKFPTADFAHDMASAIVTKRKPVKKKRTAILFRKDECGTEVPTLNGISLEV